jgi:hydroxyethylthiazole kinase
MSWTDLDRVRAQAPLVHNLTNFVVMSQSANALLAIGASPVMSHAVEEVEEMVRQAQALVLNIGTLSPTWVEAMVKAGEEARRRGIPMVRDPVGCGATTYRTATASMLLKTIRPTVVRGNASEIRALAGSGNGPKGVDSRHATEEIREQAETLSRAHRCVVSISGAVDLIVEGETVVRVANGDPMMTRVTGMGCIATAITAAFAAVNLSALHASAHAMAVIGLAGESAAARCAGPGSFYPHFLDALYSKAKDRPASRLHVQGLM